MTNNTFDKLSKVKLKIEKKGRFNYASWTEAWKKVKQLYPDASFHVYEANNVKNGILYNTGKPYFPLTKEGGAFVKVGVTIKEVEYVEHYPILNHSNRPIKYDFINVFDVNTAIKRALTKALAYHGLGLYIYEGEEIPYLGDEE